MGKVDPLGGSCAVGGVYHLLEKKLSFVQDDLCVNHELGEIGDLGVQKIALKLPNDLKPKGTRVTWFTGSKIVGLRKGFQSSELRSSFFSCAASCWQNIILCSYTRPTQRRYERLVLISSHIDIVFLWRFFFFRSRNFDGEKPDIVGREPLCLQAKILVVWNHSRIRNCEFFE